MIAIKVDSMVFYDVGRKLEIEMNNFLKNGNYNSSAAKMIPMIVNYAFSDELALKFILTKNQIDFEKKHNLIDLFLLLPNNIITYFISNISTMLKSSKEFVLSELSSIANSFIEWRYFYEGKTKITNIQVLSRFSYLLNQFLKYEENKTNDEVLNIIENNFELIEFFRVHITKWFFESFWL